MKDSFSFVEEVRHQNATSIMASLDVDSLFTNIPLEETIDICVRRLYKDSDIVNGINKKDFRVLLEISTKESFFIFDDEYYRQIDGVAMGSPLGPTLANIFLCYHEENWLKECCSSFQPIFYRRYVDDIFVLFHSVEQFDRFYVYMELCCDNQ